MGMYDQLDGMEEILNDFVVETNELIEQLNDDLLTLENRSDDADQVNRIFRAFHTIKGTCGFLNFTVCGDLAHHSENILNMIRNNELDPNPDIIDSLLDSVDWIKEFVIDVENRTEREYDISSMVNAIEDLIAHAGSFASQENQDQSGSDLQNIPEELISEFVSEATELIELLDNEILTLEIEAGDDDYLNSIFRAFHTLKGNSALMGLEQMSTIAHHSEDVLNLIREKKHVPKNQTVDALLGAVDLMRDTVEGVKEHKIIDLDVSELEHKLMGILGLETKNTMPRPAAKATAKLAKKATVKKSAQKKIDQTIRVDVERLDNLMNLAGELVLEKNRLIQVSQAINRSHSGSKDVGDLDSLNNSLGMVTTEIQESVMKMRMLPISYVFRKFPRLVRDLAKDRNKKVDLQTTGEDTELDRSVIESIGDPFVHLLRNAVDHGVESPEERLIAGKPETGVIALSAYQEGNNIVIEIEDDGAGIDQKAVIQKALDKRLITDEEAGRMTTREINNLIFRPGFSTAKVVTDVSGRGVGMDVVHSNISKLNGTVDIKSEIGKGTTFKVKLPLTLTIQSGMVVSIYDEHYIIPLTNILETIKLEDDILFAIKGNEVIRLRDAVLPIIRLDDLLKVPEKLVNGSVQYVVVVSVAEKQIGLVVSNLIGQEETVVKPLGRAMGKVPFIAGATIRGDGQINLILDVPEIIEERTRLNDMKI